MDNNTNRDADAIPEAILEEAAIWQARLLDADPESSEGRDLRVRLNEWLSADSWHRQAYAEMESLWGALETPTSRVMAEQAADGGPVTPVTASPDTQHHPPSRRSLTGLATAACLALGLLAGLGWQQDWPTRWQSDYTTAVGEQRSVELDDDSRITLNTHSAIAVAYSDARRRVTLLRGEAWFDVAGDGDRLFVVETGQGRVSVTGTRFNIRLDNEDNAVVSLDEGSIRLSAGGVPDAESMTLEPGQQARLAGAGISGPTDFDRGTVTAWKRGRFVFYNTPLARVVDTLNRHRPGRIMVLDDELNELEVSGVFSIEEPDAALEVITNTLPVQQTRLTDYLVLLR